jgi:hypothetical protein
MWTMYKKLLVRDGTSRRDLKLSGRRTWMAQNLGARNRWEVTCRT